MLLYIFQALFRTEFSTCISGDPIMAFPAEKRAIRVRTDVVRVVSLQLEFKNRVKPLLFNVRSERRANAIRIGCLERDLILHSCSCTCLRPTAIWTKKCCSRKRIRRRSTRTGSLRAWNCWRNRSSRPYRNSGCYS